MSTFSSTSMFGRLAGLYCTVTRLIDKLQPLLLLGFRLYVARVFLLSGLTKVRDWSITLALFTDDGLRRGVPGCDLSDCRGQDNLRASFQRGAQVYKVRLTPLAPASVL